MSFLSPKEFMVQAIGIGAWEPVYCTKVHVVMVFSFFCCAPFFMAGEQEAHLTTGAD